MLIHCGHSRKLPTLHFTAPGRPQNISDCHAMPRTPSNSFGQVGYELLLPCLLPDPGHEVTSSGAAEAIVLRLGREFSQRRGDLGPITSGLAFRAIYCRLWMKLTSHNLISILSKPGTNEKKIAQWNWKHPSSDPWTNQWSGFCMLAMSWPFPQQNQDLPGLCTISTHWIQTTNTLASWSSWWWIQLLMFWEQHTTIWMLMSFVSTAK